MNARWIKCTLLTLFFICSIEMAHSQSTTSDVSFHPYHVNYWVTGSIVGVGAVTNILGIPQTLHKTLISPMEMTGLNRSNVSGIDRWALDQTLVNKASYDSYSNYFIAVSVALPGFLLFDKQIKQDWFDLLTMYAETLTLTINTYEWSFLGPTFQNRFRPITYYTQLPYDQRQSGANRNSFYSGHVATVAASTFFMTKVYCDYNPGIGNNKYLLFSAATVPPLILGYLRFRGLEHFPSDILVGLGVGAFVGIIVPELHRIQDRNLSFSLYSTTETTGIALTWRTNILE